ncbi:MAG: GAF domain-containing protein [Deltaproteobacteria bacterium]|nr:GAF domain-containing protein [Deltaproteobacteria bacterium]
MSDHLHDLFSRVHGVITGPGERDAKLQTISDLLRENVDHYDWVGFYLVEPGTRTLVLGPFAGEPTEHVRIPFGKGICGQAAESGETFVVHDVTAEDNYLSCSASVRSEIVLPLFKDGAIAGELDIDSHVTSPFTNEDRDFLEGICTFVSGIL